jgi:acetyltransferase-like isoleucine patch superfamily enzyme
VQLPADLYGPVQCADGVLIGEHAVLGCPKEARVDDYARGGPAGRGAPVVIGPRTILMHHVVAYEGVTIGAGCVLEDRVRLGYDCTIGDSSRLVHGAYLCDRVEVGTDCRIAGFVCDGARIGHDSTVMGRLVHEYSQPHQGWWVVDEAPPVVHEHTVVAMGAIVIGGVSVGPRAYVAAGAVVTKDVPPGTVVTGTNVHTPISRWPGVRLRELIEKWSSEHAAGDITT